MRHRSPPALPQGRHRRGPFPVALGVLLALSGCKNSSAPLGEDTRPSDSADNSDPDTSHSVVLLSDADRLIRIAMTLKGTRPSLEELDAVAADPDALGGIVDSYLDSPEFGATVRDIENQTLLVRKEDVPNSHEIEDGDHLGTLDIAYYRYEEPLVLIEYVVTNDQPYTNILTMEGTFGTAFHDRIWDSVEGDFDPDGPEWQPMRYTDGRGDAGVLTTNGWNARWASNPNNAHRLGAAQATAALICTDYLTDDVQLGSVDLTDDDAVFNAILTDPACVSCHQTMDPFAGALFGFVGPVAANTEPYPTVMFDIADANDGLRSTGRETGYYGLGGGSLTEFAELMAQDSRFSSCTARRYLAWTTQRPLNDVPLEAVAEAQTVLVDSGMNLKAMVKHLVMRDDFAVSHSTDEADAESTYGLLHTRPEQLDRFYRDLVGFTWTGTYQQRSNFYVVPTSSSRGFRVHGGGIEVEEKQIPVHMHSASASAFLRAFAAEAAAHAVSTDFDSPASERALLNLVELDTTDESLLRAQFAALHLRIYGERVASDSAEVDDSLALLTDLDALNDDREEVWIMVLTAMMQDLRVATY